MSSSSSSSTCVDVAVVTSSEQLCYIHCNFCNIVLAVSVPCNNMFDTVTVRCGNCTNMWPVNVGMAAAFHQSSSLSAGSTSTFQAASSNSHLHQQGGPNNIATTNYRATNNMGLSQDCSNKMPMTAMIRPRPHAQAEINSRPPEKRQRVPSLYNRFIKEEIQRIKANNPDISHKEAFSNATKNWAHFPHIQYGLMLENNHHQANLDEGLRSPANDKA